MGSLGKRLLPFVATCTFALSLAPSAHASFPGQNGKISFEVGGGGGCIESINPDGTGREFATACDPEATFDTSPAWAPDGHRLALADEGNFIAYVTDGANRVFVFGRDDGIDSIGWSPDGERLVADNFCISGECDEELFTVGRDGTGYFKLPPAGDNADWSPDGTQIAFQIGGGVSVIAPDGTGLTPIASNAAHPSWSPDSQRIAFLRAGDIWIMNRDGTQQSPVITAGGQPAWSPDGTRIAFVRQLSSMNYDIYAADVDGSDEVNITNTADQIELVPTWQPIPGPLRADYKNRAAFCRAERDFLGEQQFRAKYGTNGNAANAHGKCVSGK